MVIIFPGVDTVGHFQLQGGEVLLGLLSMEYYTMQGMGPGRAFLPVEANREPL